MSSSTSILHLPHVPALSWEDCRLLVESVVDYAIFMLDVEGRVATWNPGAEKIKGYSASEIIGEHFSRFYPPEALERGWPDHELAVFARSDDYFFGVSAVSEDGYESPVVFPGPAGSFVSVGDPAPPAR